MKNSQTSQTNSQTDGQTNPKKIRTWSYKSSPIKRCHAYIFHKQLDKCTETDQLGWNLTSNERMNGIHLKVEIYLENANNNF